MKDQFKNRLRFVYIIILLFVLVSITKLFLLQIVKSDFYRNEANNQYLAPSGTYFDRGEIYFQNKDGSLISAATIKEGYYLAIIPSKIENATTTYEKISKIIDLDKNIFFDKVNKKTSGEVILSHKIDKEIGEQIKNLKLKGLNLSPERWRFYPGNNLASRVLGFVGYDGNMLTGRYGVEKFYDSILKRDDKNIFKNSFVELLGDIKNFSEGKNQPGDIVLTIEPSVQAILEKNLEKIIEKYNSELAGGIILDPKTGKIFAMAVKPDFNPNNYSAVQNLSLFTNPLVENVFELGSIMKPITIAAAINEGKVSADTTYFDKGYVELSGKKIRNFDNKSRGLSTIQDVLSYSINTGAVFTMQQLGREKFADYLLKAGFNEKTGIDLPAEVQGKISNVINSPRDLEYATASFGQGIAVTPIEMVRSLASLANGGYIVKPFIVEEIKLEGNKDQKKTQETGRQLFKKETADELSRMLVNVFDKGILGGLYKIDHHSIAAKTGTAQMAIEGKKGYQEGNYIHSFFGYFPAFDAKFFIFLFTVKPRGVSLASHSMTEPFVNITKFLINYYQIPPDR